MNIFQVGDTTFHVDRLKVKQSLKGIQIVGAICGPALGAAANAPEGTIGTALEHLSDNLDRLPELLDMFAPRTKYTNADRPNPTDLGPFIEDIFGGRIDHCVQYLAKCVEGEYGSFFDANSPIRGYLGAAMEKFSDSQPTPKTSGQSGGS